jgi:hypothetical protein
MKSIYLPGSSALFSGVSLLKCAERLRISAVILST